MTSSIFFSTREATWHQALALWAELGSGSVSEATWAEGLSPKQPALTTPAMFLSALLPWLLGCYPNSATGHGETTSGTHSQLGGFLHPFIWCPLGWEGLWDLLGGVGYRSSLLHPSSEVCPRGWDCPPRRGDLNQPVPALPSKQSPSRFVFPAGQQTQSPSDVWVAYVLSHCVPCPWRGVWLQSWPGNRIPLGWRPHLAGSSTACHGQGRYHV